MITRTRDIPGLPRATDAVENTPPMARPDDSARFRLLYDLACAFAARIEIDELIPHVVKKCREVLNAEGVSVMLLDADCNELYFPYVAEDNPEVAARVASLRFPADQGIAGAALKLGRPLRVDDVQNDPRFYRGIDQNTGLTTRNVLAAPLTANYGVVGLLEVVNSLSGQPFSDEDLAFLEALAGSIAVAISNARLYGQTKASEQLLRTEVGALRRDLARHDVFGEIIGTGKAMANVFRLMESAAASWITVLIEGETGTGKELVARGIHRASARASGPFLAVNCAALPETLLESELFGHRRGAFTGAISDQPGLFRAAAGGVMFLDEVGDMPMSMQAKLLRVLEQGEVVPVGEAVPRKVDVRVICATNRDLKAETAKRNFRDDLYYRLSAFPIRLPPLRQRREDIALIALKAVANSAARHSRQITGIEPAALEMLVRYSWPGNIRELLNEIERAVALARSNANLSPEQLSESVRSPGATPRSESSAEAGSVQNAPQPGSSMSDGAISVSAPSTKPLREARAEFEAQFIAKVLGEHSGNVSRSAQAMGLSRVALQKKMKDYHLR
jgi:Nif-specific regulatory protein